MPKLHDYTKRFWGHDYTWMPNDDGGVTGTAMGWGYGLETDDYTLLAASGNGASYKIVEVRYYGDPADMWQAKLRYVNEEELDEVSRLYSK